MGSREVSARCRLPPRGAGGQGDPVPPGKRQDLAPEAVAYVGDNLQKDMPAAQACGALGVWAEYGTYVSAEYRERLAVISARAVTERHVAEEPGRGTPRWPLAISSFRQVLDVLDGFRWQGPKGRGRRR